MCHIKICVELPDEHATTKPPDKQSNIDGLYDLRCDQSEMDLGMVEEATMLETAALLVKSPTHSLSILQDNH